MVLQKTEVHLTDRTEGTRAHRLQEAEEEEKEAGQM
jgi:hypothetical protein